MTQDQQRTNEILSDLKQIKYVPDVLPREKRLGEIQTALDSCIQAFASAGASAECLDQLQQMKGMR